jgi:hypothetical protein
MSSNNEAEIFETLETLKARDAEEYGRVIAKVREAWAEADEQKRVAAEQARIDAARKLIDARMKAADSLASSLECAKHQQTVIDDIESKLRNLSPEFVSRAVASDWPERVRAINAQAYRTDAAAIDNALTNEFKS